MYQDLIFSKILVMNNYKNYSNK